MSGGSHNYMYHQVEETYVGKMFDVELHDMIQDLVEVMHDCEWYDSGDISEEDYRATVHKFKEKWFGTRDLQLRHLIQEELLKVSNTLSKL